MISKEQKKILEELGRSHFGRVLREYLEEKSKEIGDIRRAASWEDTLGRRYALDLIRDLFSVMEEREVTQRMGSDYK